MPFRFWVFEKITKGSLSSIKWISANLLIIVGLWALITVLDIRWGADDYKWGLTMWMSGIVAFSGVVTFNTFLYMMGIGYDDWKSQQNN